MLVNGNPMKKFDMGCSLGQGDPLLSFLFLIVVDGFNLLMRKVVDLGRYTKFIYEGEKYGRISG